MMDRRERILDELLVIESRRGNAAAFEQLARRWQPRMLRLARRLTASREAGEVVQEAWLAIVRGLRRLDDPARFGPWALRIVAHKSTDWIRHRQKSRSLAEKVAREPEAPQPPTAGERIDRSRAVARLRDSFAALSASHRDVLELFYLRSLPVRSIADRLGISPGTVKSRLFHARKTLRETLEDGT